MKTFSLKFDPGALSIIQMGEELIGHPSTSLGELVKNGYDADALECKIYIHPLDLSFVVIFDNGTGMDEKTLFGEWLQPSVSSKRKGNRKSKVFQRPFLGSKGIGRLAAMALGKNLTVISKTNNDKNYNWVYVDREIFKNDNELLSNISFPGGVIKSYQELLNNPQLRNENNLSINSFLLKLIENIAGMNFNEGTLIIIEDIDESVKIIISEDYSDGEMNFSTSSLIRGLRTLVTPLNLIEKSQKELKNKGIITDNYYNRQTDDSFTVNFGISLYDESYRDFSNLYLEPVEPVTIIDQYHYRAIGKCTESGEIIGHYYCQRLAKHDYNEKFHLDSVFVWSDEVLRQRRNTVDEEEIIPDELKNADVGEFFFDIRIYDRDIDAIEQMQRVLKLNGKLETRRFLDQILGFRIAKNSFGVKPYGEEEKDWMGLGQMRVQNPTKNIGPNQILGYIYLLSPENDGLKEKTNREGFFENKAFINLKKIIRAILVGVGRRRLNFRLKYNLGRAIKHKHGLPDTKEFITYLNTTIDNPKVVNRAKEFISDITTAFDNMEHSLSFSQRLATLGSGLELVYHELSQPITQLGAVKSSFELNINQVKDSFKKSFHNNIQIFDSSLDVLEQLKKSLMPAIGIAKPRNFSPSDTFLKVCTLFKKDISDYNIAINIDTKFSDYKIKDYEYPLWISFLNIINNATYWLKRSENIKIINLLLENKNIVINNNGPEIDEDNLELIFEYGVTAKHEKNATGLGLAFTRNILSSYDWEIKAENRSNGPAFIIYKKG